MSNTKKTFKLIAVDVSNYSALKELGKAGDSFNDVIAQILKQLEDVNRST